MADRKGSDTGAFQTGVIQGRVKKKKLTVCDRRLHGNTVSACHHHYSHVGTAQARASDTYRAV